MSATVIPTFFHKRETAEDIPVWELTTGNGRKFLCQRTNVKGLVPLNVTGLSYFSQKDGLVVCEAKIPSVKQNQPYIITVQDGFRVPRCWYGFPGETHTDITPLPPRNNKEFNEENFPALAAQPQRERR